MKILTNADIDNLCRRAAGLPHEWAYSPQPIFEILDLQMIDLFYNLYNTGLRYTEMTSKNRWEMIDPVTYRVTTLKHSNPRIIAAADLSQQFINSQKLPGKLYPSCLYSTTAIWLQRAFHPLAPRIKNKKVTTHIFRHNFIKRLAQEGKEIEEIQTITGEVDGKNVETYIRSIIYLE